MCNVSDLSKSLGESLCSFCKKEREELFPVVPPFNLRVFNRHYFNDLTGNRLVH